MRPRLIIFALLTSVLLMAGHSAAHSYKLAPNAAPAHFLPLVRHDSPTQPLPSATSTATATSAPTPTPSATPSPTASTTPVTSATLGISGTVFVKPRWGTYQAQPLAYQILLDVSRPMSYDFNGHGTVGGTIAIGQDTVGGTDYHCHLGSINEPLPYSSDCGPWRHVAERRVYVAKQALARLIDQLGTQDTMRIIAFSSALPGGTSALGAGWSSDKAALKQAVLAAGAYNGDSYRTEGWDSAAQALEMARQSWANGAPISAPNGQPYGRVTIYITGSTPAVFLDGQINYAQDVCPQYQGDLRALDDAWCQYDKDDYPVTTHGPRPISAMVYQAQLVKDGNPTLLLFALSLGQINPIGLDEVASSPGMLLLATEAGGIALALDQMQSQAISFTRECMASSTNSWIGTIDAAHRADSPPMPPLPSGVYGYVYLTDDLGQPVSVPWTGPGADPRSGVTNMIPIVTDLNSAMTYSLPPSAGLTAGNYHLTGYVDYKAADADPTAGGDGQSRQYSRLMQNGLQVQNISFTLTPSQVLGSSIVIDPLQVDLNLNVNLCA